MHSAEQFIAQTGGFFNHYALAVCATGLNFLTLGLLYVCLAISNLMGIHSPINFNKPTFVRDLKKSFWNRWHMSLSFWFRLCLYADGHGVDQKEGL